MVFTRIPIPYMKNSDIKSNNVAYMNIASCSSDNNNSREIEIAHFYKIAKFFQDQKALKSLVFNIMYKCVKYKAVSILCRETVICRLALILYYKQVIIKKILY